MTRDHRSSHAPLRLTLLAAALLSVFDTARAEDGNNPEVTALVRPDSAFSAGLGYVDNDSQRYGLYTGLVNSGTYGLFELDLVRRQDDTGTWFRVGGRNLGLDNQKLRVEHERQGEWGYFIDYGKTSRLYPYVIETSVDGIGGDRLTVPGIASRPVKLHIERETYKAGLDKTLGAGLSLSVRARTEHKDGARLWGRAGPQFLAEPLDSITDVVEATLAYTEGRLQLNGGYYGTQYRNQFASLVVNGETDGGASTLSPIGLPPDNESHQFFLNGGYNFDKTTRATFKLAYTRATQNDRFIPVSTAAGIGDDLGGRVDTALAYFGLSARPLPRLSLSANLRYEDRDDRTPVRLYYDATDLSSGGFTWLGHNEPRSIRMLNGKLEASYRFDAGYRLTAGVDYDEKKRNTSPVRVVSYRKEVDETAFRLEARRSMSETINGTVAYIRSERRGSGFVTTTLANGAEGSNLVAPLHLADRNRDKVRLSVDWAPLQALSLQLMYEESQDDYGLRSFGMDTGMARLYSLDASYTLAEDWRAHAWVSRQDTEADQRSTTRPGQATTTAWSARLRNRGDAAGLGLEGPVSPKLQVAVELQHSRDASAYRMQRIDGLSGASALDVASLPETYYRLTSLQLTGKYAVQRNLGLRLDYRYERYATDDWTWAEWTYADGTTVSEEPRQRVHFVGISAVYRF